MSAIRVVLPWSVGEVHANPNPEILGEISAASWSLAFTIYAYGKRRDELAFAHHVRFLLFLSNFGRYVN